MKKLVFLLSLSTYLFAINGEAVFNKHCIECHASIGMMSMDGNNHGMKAPSMQMISMRLKHMTDSKKSFIEFVKDYIQNPSQEKGFCMPMAYKRFGVMPAIGKNLTEVERDAVANWMYDAFNDSWNGSMGGKMCKHRNNAK